MLLDTDEFLDKLVEQEVKTAHYEKKFNTCVLPTKDLNSKIKKAITDLKGAKFLKDADYVIGCVVPQESPIEEQPKEDDEKDNSEETEETNDTSTEETTSDKKDDTEETDSTKKDKEQTDDTPTFGNEEETEETNDNSNNEEEEDDEKKKGEGLNESVKVEDLTKKMLSVPKAKKVGCCSSCKSTPKKMNEDDKKTKSEPKKEKKLEEAETKVSGEILKDKFADAVKRVFKSQLNDGNEIVVDELPEFMENAKVYFTTISIKKSDSQSETK